MRRDKHVHLALAYSDQGDSLNEKNRICVPTPKYTHYFYMNPFIGWHNISQFLKTVYYLSNLINYFDYVQSQNFGRAQNIYLVTLHGQLKGIITHKMIRLTTLMKKGGINHL